MKKKGIRLLSILLCLMMMFSLVACGQEEPTGEGAFNPGKYTATTKRHNGELTVEVEFDKSSIVSVSVTKHNESPGITDVSLERIPQEIVDNRSLAVDSISGATVTSEAILTAAEDCVKQAGGDVDALKSISLKS